MHRADRLACAAVLLWATACDGHDPSGPGSSVPASITLSPPALAFTALGTSGGFIATVRSRQGDPMPGVKVDWRSSDSTIARVDSAGLVTAIADGSVTVKASSGSLEASASVTVAQAAASILVEGDGLDFAALGDTAMLSATIRDANGHSLTSVVPVWSSSDTMVVRVEAPGRIVSVGSGSATVAASVGAVAWSGTAHVVQVPASFSISGAPTRSLAIGDTATFVAVVADANGRPIPDALVEWSSSDTTVATVDGQGRIRSIGAGSTMIVATSAGLADTASVTLTVLNLKVETVPTNLSTPAPGALWEIPVVIIRMMPTNDGQTVDFAETGFAGTLNDLRRRIEVFEERIKFMLEEGSRFRGYQDATAPYSLGYRVVRIVTIYEPFEHGYEVPWNPGHYFPDYHWILSLVDAESWVNDHGVKEFWVWGYHTNEFEQPESDMSSPFTGDISNSSRFADDLPVFDHTYTLYGYNFGRTQAEAVHNHGHQIEALLGYIDGALFWKEFVGQDNAGHFMTGRAGWTHMPPNTTTDYDYENPTVVQSDIADWKPGGGQTSPVSANTWGSVPYAWPMSRAPGESAVWQRVESQWYMYWMQSMPGRGNAIPFGSGTMTNWWWFTGDWDAAIAAGQRLSDLPPNITVRNDYSGGIALSPGGGLAPGEVASYTSVTPITVSVWDCGEPGGCKWDPYVLHPGKAYHVITDPAGPAANLTIAEIS